MAERYDRNGPDITSQLELIQTVCEQASRINWGDVGQNILRLQEKGHQCQEHDGCEIQNSLRKQLEETPKQYEENKKLKKQVKQLSAEIERLICQMKQQEEPNEELKNSYLKYIEQLRKENEELKMKHDCTKTTFKSFEDNFTKTLDECDRYKKEKEYLQRQNKNCKSTIVQLSNELKRLEDELRETKNRLSRLMSAQVTDNNPDIADLSDVNRPNKLAERYQELYDNQWSDAFEALEKSYPFTFTSEEKRVKYLLKLLQGVRRFCEDTAEEQTHELKRVLFTKECNKSLPGAVGKPLKDIKKAMIPSNVDILYQNFLDSPKMTNCVGIESTELKSYIQECILVCWIMVLNDPPIVFGREVGPYDRFDTNLYKSYTEKGAFVAYVVWPPLIVSESGALLTKGTAQATAVGKTHVQSAPSARTQSAPRLRADGGTEGHVRVFGLEESLAESRERKSDFLDSSRSRQSHSYSQHNIRTIVPTETDIRHWNNSETHNYYGQGNYQPN